MKSSLGRSKGRGRARATPSAQSQGPGAPTAAVSSAQSNVPPSTMTAAGATSQLTHEMRQLTVTDKPSSAPRAETSETRGGLQRRLRNAVIEANVQPQNITNKVGYNGQQVQLKTNFCTFRCLPEDNFNIYDLLFNFPLTFNRKIEFLKQLQESNHIPQGPFAYDGRRIYTPQSWTPDPDTPIQLQLDGPKMISIRRVSYGTYNSEQYFHLLNIIFNNVQVLLGQDRVGKSYCMPCNSAAGNGRDDGVRPTVINFEHLSLHGGYDTAFQRGTSNEGPITIMHIDKSFRILSQRTAWEFLAECTGNYGPKKSEILGRVIMTKYNNKTYTVNDIKENVSINDQFEVEGKDGSKKLISYRMYFRDRYNIDLQHNSQTFIVSRSKRRDIQKIRRRKQEGGDDLKGAPPEDTTRELLLPSELCYLCGLSETEKSNYQRNKAFNEITKKGPHQRVNDVRDFKRWIETDARTHAFLEEWGIGFGGDNLIVPGRELPSPPVVSFNPSSGKFMQPLEMQDRRTGNIVRGEWDPKEIKIPCTREFRVGVLLRQPMQRTFLNHLAQVSNQMNFRFNNISEDDIVTMGRDSNISVDLREFLEMEYDIVLVAGIRPQDYAVIKSLTVKTGLLTQCIVKRNFEDARKGMSIATKVAIQMACKLGLDAWRVKYTCPHLKTMVVGMDTYHNKSQKKTVQSTVFSYNPYFTQYINLAWIDKGRQELNTRMGVYFNKALQMFAKKNNFLPERIVVFRDGVGDSQLEATKNIEIETLKKELEGIYAPNPPPHLIVIIVKKRIYARFFLSRGPQVTNPTAGTVVDQQIVKPNFYEFFLVSQMTRQGCSTPTNYNVIEDTRISPSDTGYLSPGDIQQLSYSLTHLYFNWPGTIRVPAPVHYAHKLAFLIGQSVPDFENINEHVSDKLFYL